MFRNVRAFQDRIGIWKCWFLRRGENRSTRRKTSQSRVENQQQTQPTYDAGSGNRTRATLVGGERSHHCAIPAPQEVCCKYVARSRQSIVGIISRGGAKYCDLSVVSQINYLPGSVLPFSCIFRAFAAKHHLMALRVSRPFFVGSYLQVT